MDDRKSLTRSLAVVAVASLCILSYLFVDRPLAIRLHGIEHTSLQRVFAVITRLGESQWTIVPGFLLFLAFRKSRKHAAMAGLFVAGAVAVSGLVVDLLKFVLGRARPSLYFERGLYGFDLLHGVHARQSFPSGHAATAFSAALALALLFPRHRWACVAAAAVVAASRVILEQHYVSDVIAGAGLGVASTMFLYDRVFRARLAAAPGHWFS